MEKQDWSSEEKFFARSWSHIFYFWKLRQIMLAKTVRHLLAQRQGDQDTVVIDLGCGPGTNLFDAYDASEDMQWVLKPQGYAMVTRPNPRNLPEIWGYFLDKITFGGFKRFCWKGQDEVSAPPLDAAVGFGHVHHA